MLKSAETILIGKVQGTPEEVKFLSLYFMLFFSSQWSLIPATTQSFPWIHLIIFWCRNLFDEILKQRGEHLMIEIQFISVKFWATSLKRTLWNPSNRPLFNPEASAMQLKYFLPVLSCLPGRQEIEPYQCTFSSTVPLPFLLWSVTLSVSIAENPQVEMNQRTAVP